MSRCPRCCTRLPLPGRWLDDLMSTSCTTTPLPDRCRPAAATSRRSSPCTARSPASRASTTASSAARSTWSRSRRRSDVPRRTCPGSAPCTTQSTSRPFRSATDKDDVLLFLGRLHPDKGVHLAIDAARGGRAADRGRRQVHRAGGAGVLRARTSSRGSGRTSRCSARPTPTGKRDLLARAAALVFPIVWDEPFGMVMIEAMACGTPVVALRRGSVPEVVIDGVTGIICDLPAQLPDAIHAAPPARPASLPRARPRRLRRRHHGAALRAIYRASIAARSPLAVAPQALHGPRPFGGRPRPPTGRTVAASGNHDIPYEMPLRPAPSRTS